MKIPHVGYRSGETFRPVGFPPVFQTTVLKEDADDQDQFRLRQTQCRRHRRPGAGPPSETTSRQPSAPRKRNRLSPTRARGSDMSSPAWLTIIVSIITACGGGIVGWATKRFDAGWATKADIDRLAGEIAKLDVQFAKVCSKLDNDNRRLNSIEQSAMRSELFAATQDRTHARTPARGRQTIPRRPDTTAPAMSRITQLKADYSRRLRIRQLGLLTRKERNDNNQQRNTEARQVHADNGASRLVALLDRRMPSPSRHAAMADMNGIRHRRAGKCGIDTATVPADVVMRAARVHRAPAACTVVACPTPLTPTLTRSTLARRHRQRQGDRRLRLTPVRRPATPRPRPTGSWSRQRASDIFGQRHPESSTGSLAAPGGYWGKQTWWALRWVNRVKSTWGVNPMVYTSAAHDSDRRLVGRRGHERRTVGRGLSARLTWATGCVIPAPCRTASARGRSLPRGSTPVPAVGRRLVSGAAGRQLVLRRPRVTWREVRGRSGILRHVQR